MKLTSNGGVIKKNYVGLILRLMNSKCILFNRIFHNEQINADSK